VVVENRLVLEDGRYRMDVDALAAQARDAAMLILCNPHNPVGRVWTREELARVGEICLAHGVILVSDDIHGDFAFARPYTPIAMLDDAIAQASITCLAGSKTFNIAGLATSYEVIPNPELRAKMHAEKCHRGILHPNMFGLLALDAVYREGDAWLEALRAYLVAGQRLLHEYLDPLENVHLIEPEGTFLAWLDCRALSRPSQALVDELLWAGVRLTAGRVFGETGEGFLRLNYGTSHVTLREGLARTARAFREMA
jgi:cystathionine beta-lyase